MIDVQWQDSEHRVLLVSVRGTWGWKANDGIAAKVRAMMRERPDVAIDVIVHFLTGLMPSGSLVVDGLAVIRKPEPNLKRVILVVPNTLLNRLMNITFGMSEDLKQRYKVVASMKAAQALVERDSTPV